MKTKKPKEINIVALQLICQSIQVIATNTNIGNIQARCVDLLEIIYKDLKGGETK